MDLTWFDSATSNLAGGVGAVLVVSGVSAAIVRVRRALQRAPSAALTVEPATTSLPDVPTTKVEVMAKSEVAATAKDVASGALVVAGWLLILGASFWLVAVAFGLCVTLVRKGVAYVARAFQSSTAARAGGADGGAEGG